MGVSIGDVWLQGSFIIFFASLIQSLTGFGFGLVAIPLLLFILPSQQALMVGMILSALSSFLQGVTMIKIARWNLIVKLLLLSTPGLFIGVFLSNYLNALFIKGIVGVVLVVYVIWQWLNFRRKYTLKKRLEASSGNSGITKNPLTGNSIEVISAGFFSGLLNGLAAIPGPPIVALLIKHLDKDTFQATTVTFFFLQYTVTTIAKLTVQRDLFTLSLAKLIFSMVLAIFLGLLVGEPIRKRINEENFKRLVYTLLFVIGLTSLWEPIRTLLLG